MCSYLRKVKLMEIYMNEEISWDDMWEDEPLTPEEAEASRRAEARVAHEEALGEIYNARFCFD